MIEKIIGTGGIGSGIFFKLCGETTMGRNESRPAVLTPYRDYCKAHIILHYVSVLSSAKVLIIGKVGKDPQGDRLIEEMKGAGIITEYIERVAEAPTMYAVCFQYPNGEGGNITASNSACELVSPEFVKSHSELIDSRSLVLAAPEVPLASRIELLKIGKQKKALTAASFLTSEAAEFEERGGYGLTDILSINSEEAGAVLPGGAEGIDGMGEIIKKIKSLNPRCKVIITAGKDGVYIGEGEKIEHLPCLPAEVVSTAGAGDALLGGVIAGLAKGTSFTGAVEFGLKTAKCAVESENTIAEDEKLRHILSV